MANIVALGFVPEIEKRLRDDGYFYSSQHRGFIEAGSNNLIRINPTLTSVFCDQVWTFIGAQPEMVNAFWDGMVVRPRVLKDFR